MIKHESYNLAPKNTFHINAMAQNFYIPESENELISLLLELENEELYILSGGSNILINDKKIYKNIISMEKVDLSLTQINKDLFYIGASNRIQNVLKFLNSLNYGGFEELVSLPAMLGGIIYMNAGIGGEKNSKFTISKFIKRVKVLEKSSREVKWLKNNECKFSHRQSLFMNDNYIILGAEIEAIVQSEDISQERIKKRLEHCRKKQNMGKGCFGTCFSHANPRILKIVRLISSKKARATQDKENSNWIVNNGNATFKDVMRIIRRCKLLHRLFGQEIECEVRIWE